jgi:hypothetical protein
MKKLLLGFVLTTCLAGASVFSWAPEDFMEFPSAAPEGAFMLNLGVGLGIPEYIGSDYFYVPPIRATLDYNFGIGDNNLPFFAGGMFGYSGQGYKDWYYSKISFGGRFGYHFNWDVDKLDTYAVTTAGWTVYSGDGIPDLNKIGGFLFGINVGARYFFTPFFGVWSEIGYNSLSFIDLGIAFKF